MPLQSPIVVHLTASRFFGGPERQMLELAKEMIPVRSVFISFSEGGLCRAFLDGARREGFESIALQHDTPRLPAALRELVGVLRRFAEKGSGPFCAQHPEGRSGKMDLTPFPPPVVLCCHGYKSNLLGLLAARRLGIPAVAVSRGWTGECFKVRLYEALDRRVLRRMDKVVCVSAGQAAKVRRAGVADVKIAVIHNAVRPERFAEPDSAARAELLELVASGQWPVASGDEEVASGQWPAASGKAESGGWRVENSKSLNSQIPKSLAPSPQSLAPTPPPPCLLIGAAGRLSPEKGFDVLIDAAARVVSGQWSVASGKDEVRLPAPNHQPLATTIGFVLFGDGPLRDALARRIAARGLEGRFVLAGFRSDLDRLLPHFDLMVLPSRSEGLPNAALEAMAAGVPVVATAVGGTPELIEDGRSGLLAPPDDAAALAERIAGAAGDPPLRARLSAAARERVAQRFSFAAQAESYRELFAGLCNGKGDRRLLPNGAKGGKGDRHLLPERPEGCCAQKVPVPFSAPRRLLPERLEGCCAQKVPVPFSAATNVCFVIDSLSMAGTEMQLIELIRGLDRSKARPYLCLLKSDGVESRELEPADCPVLRLNVRSLRRPSTLAAAWRFARFLRQNKIEVVHCFFPDSTRFAVPVARMAGVRRVLASRRNLGHWMNAFDRLVARLYRRWIDLTVANCEACRQAVVEQEGIAPDRVVVILNGIDLERFAWIPPYGKGDKGGKGDRHLLPNGAKGGKGDRHLLPNGAKGGKGDRHLLPERPEGCCAQKVPVPFSASEGCCAQKVPVPFSARRVGMVANLRPVKAPDVFVRAAALVAQSHPNAVFQIAGSGDAEPVRRLARECGIEDRLELLGQVEDIPSFLAGLDVAVLSSDSEGLSNALLEYMAAGRAIVATDVGGARELIDDGRTGFLVPPQSPESMARRISQLLADPKLQNTIGENARQKAEAVFSVQRIKHEYCKIYDILAHA